MSQRGGSVVTYVRFGDKVYSPVIDKGEADFIVSFELLEARPLDRISEARRKDRGQYPEDQPHARHHRSHGVPGKPGGENAGCRPGRGCL